LGYPSGSLPSTGNTLNIKGDVNILGNLFVQGIITTSSDYRVKYNPVCLDGTYTVDHLNPLTYLNLLTNQRDIGFLAHEIQEYYPYLVIGEKDGSKFQSLNYNGLIGILTNEIKILKSQMAAQQQINVDLQTKIQYILQKMNV
jgi:hypothetical protein